jgi:hypothetical protein
MGGPWGQDASLTVTEEQELRLGKDILDCDVV